MNSKHEKQAVCHRGRAWVKSARSAGFRVRHPACRCRGAGIVQRNGMAWIILVLAGLLEIVWAIGLKYTEGFTRLWPSVGTLAAMAASVGLLGVAMRTLPVGTSYAVWVGVGAVGTVILGMVLFAEPATPGRLVSVALIVAGIIGLKLAS
jgi:quaternary ammonium compound-resistance protein SugE